MIEPTAARAVSRQMDSDGSQEETILSRRYSSLGTGILCVGGGAAFADHPVGCLSFFALAGISLLVFFSTLPSMTILRERTEETGT